jgi:hypothetical protein
VYAQASLDGLGTKATECMVLEIGGGALVLQILISAHTTHFGLAPVGCAWEEVVEVTGFIVDGNFGTEKRVYRRPPTLLKDSCETMRMTS